MTALDPNAFAVHRTVVRGDVELAYVHEGVGGLPVILLHGWPGSKRLFWKNIGPLAAAGFEVVVPDHRGFGDSPVPPDGFVDVAASSHDAKALMNSLGHERFVVVGGDFGNVVGLDLCVRSPESVIRHVTYNGAVPSLYDEYEAAGISGTLIDELNLVSDHMVEHGLQADESAAKLDTPDKRRDHVKGFLQGRVWKQGEGPSNLAGPGNISDAEADFLTEPFADAGVFRASLGFYEGFMQPDVKASEAPLLDAPIEVETMILWGSKDQIVGPNFPRRMAVACRNAVGPFLVQDCGHFVQFERPDVLNSAVICFCRDLLAAHGT
jgi:pimeloyl-ACP methyl ester carboxylesterase